MKDCREDEAESVVIILYKDVNCLSCFSECRRILFLETGSLGEKKAWQFFKVEISEESVFVSLYETEFSENVWI